jgi:hypothetical protein
MITQFANARAGFISASARDVRVCRKAGIRCKAIEIASRVVRWREVISPLDQKKKAGGHYAADLVLQLPARGSGSVALHSVLLDRLVAPGAG